MKWFYIDSILLVHSQIAVGDPVETSERPGSHLRIDQSLTKQSEPAKKLASKTSSEYLRYDRPPFQIQ